MDFGEFDAPPPQQQQAQQPAWVLTLFNQINQLFIGQPALAIHRSKICALFDDLRSFMKTFDPDPNLDQATITSACAEFNETLTKIRNIAYASSNQKWTTAIVRWNHNTVYESVRTFRETLSRIVSRFHCQNATEFILSNGELEAQNNSDVLQLKGAMMDYQANLLGNANNPKVAQVISIIDNRINSIGPIDGLSDGPGVSKIPSFLPPRSRLEKIHSEFQVGETIGTGAFASVHTGTLHGFPKRVAIKMLNKKVLGGRQLETFKREVWTLASFDHPSILKLLGVTFTPPFCIITELLKTSLDKRMKYLTPTRRSVVMLRVALGMAQMHARNVIHRDLKAANILLDEDDNPRICDFGLVGFKRNTPHTGFVGTVQWMAPELLRSSPYYDEKVDVYSFAVMLYELLTLREPFFGMGQDQIVMGVIERGMRPEIASHYGPPGLIDLIEQCWAENPAERPSFDQISYMLMQPEYHFVGTNEAEFAQLAPPVLLSQELIHAFYTDDWSKIDSLLSDVNPSRMADDPELEKAVIDIYWGADGQRKQRILGNLRVMFNIEKFLANDGYNFVVQLLKNGGENAEAILNAIRSIPITSRAFRQRQLVAALANSELESAQLLLSDLVKFNDIAGFIYQYFIPLPTNTPATLSVYASLIAHKELRLNFASQVHPLQLAMKYMNENTKFACAVLALFPFGPSHMQFVEQNNVIPALVQAASRELLALPAFQHIISVAPPNLLSNCANDVSNLVSQYKEMHQDRQLMAKLSQVPSIRINPTSPQLQVPTTPPQAVIPGLSGGGMGNMSAMGGMNDLGGFSNAGGSIDPMDPFSAPPQQSQPAQSSASLLDF
ncbi:TKL family protein kinase [Tritrichomonas foetus]|uniref:TKL family protein kinase n=1 Tax=Tritrichomonas foetus TaxID=1144522 RepID=A0A1J4KQK1_9EUKA|nr:TKL family protein kinase [Tritrichomonas foetus]|eukprot:OHT13567.1 TKL family protein kinase [Tritrichomonas foetus]